MQLLAKQTSKSLGTPGRGPQEQFRLHGGVRASNGQLHPGRECTGGKQCIYPWNPCNWAARVTAQVGNKNENPCSSSPSLWLKPQSSQEGFQLHRSTLEGSWFLHLFFPVKYSTLTGLQPVIPAWESPSSLSGCGKGFTKPLT